MKPESSPSSSLLAPQSSPLQSPSLMLGNLLKKWIPFFGSLPSPFHSLDWGSFRIKLNRRMRSRAGVCKPSENLIELNPHILVTERALEEVLVHELCHLSVSRRWPYAQSHGSKWKTLMNHCGFEANRCHNLEVGKRHFQRRWQVDCACSTHQIATITYNRLRRGTRYKCLSCGSPLKLTR